MALEDLCNAKSWGMVIYEIMNDGSLKGSWADTHYGTQQKTMLEIAMPVEEKNVGDDIDGKYTDTYIQGANDSVTGVLTISKQWNDGTYELEWRGKENKQKYTGIGFKIGEKQIAVTYWKVKKENIDG